MSILKRLLPGFIRNRYESFQSRLKNLESSVRFLDTAVDTILVNPKYIADETIGFNGQRHRKKIFLEIINAIAFDAFVETGAWLSAIPRATSAKTAANRCIPAN